MKGDLRVGIQCTNCEPNVHTHADHSYYDPQACLIMGCHCRKLKIKGFENGQTKKKKTTVRATPAERDAAGDVDGLPESGVSEP